VHHALWSGGGCAAQAQSCSPLHSACHLQELTWTSLPHTQALGTFHLAAFLASMRQQGYTVFVIRGQLPRPQAPSHPGPAGPGRWFTADEVGAGWLACSVDAGRPLVLIMPPAADVHIACRRHRP
jgi:hypothetical protein